MPNALSFESFLRAAPRSALERCRPAFRNAHYPSSLTRGRSTTCSRGETRVATERSAGCSGTIGGQTRRICRVGWRMYALLTALLVPALPPLASTTLAQTTTTSGFVDQVVLSGLTNPTAVRFSKDGRVFVAEKSGLIEVFDSLTDPSGTVFADLRTNVHNYWDRGLLSLELDPGFPERPYIYVLYTYDGPVGGPAPRWGSAGQTSDPCPDRPGATTDGCEVTGRLSRLQAAGNVMTGTERVSFTTGFSSSPAIRSAICASVPTAPCTRAAATGQFPVRGLRPARESGRRPAGWPWRGPTRAGCRRWSAPGAGCPHLWRSRRAERHHHSSRPGNGGSDADQSECVERGSKRTPHRRLRLSQSFPVHIPTRHRRSLGCRRWLAILRRNQPHRQSARGTSSELRLALLRGRLAAGGIRCRRADAMRNAICDGQRGRVASLSALKGPTTASAGEGVSVRRSVHHGRRVLRWRP